VLERTIPVFWKRGFADTDLQSLEKATGVNKSGLYSEFESKEELFLATLRYYLQRRPESALLSSEPLGWRNIEKFLHAALSSPDGQRGCLAVNSMRELAVLPSAANKVVAKSLVKIKQLLVKNIKVEQTKMSPEAVACIVATFFSVLCVEQNMRTSRSASVRLARSVSSCTSCPALVSKPAISKPYQDSSGPRSNAVQPTKFQRIRQDPRYADLLKKYACRHKAIKRAKHPGRQDRTG